MLVVTLNEQEEGKCQDFWPHTRQNWWMALCFETCHSSAASVSA